MTRVKKECRTPADRVDAREVRSLVPIAPVAGEGQVVEWRLDRPGQSGRHILRSPLASIGPHWPALPTHPGVLASADRPGRRATLSHSRSKATRHRSAGAFQRRLSGRHGARIANGHRPARPSTKGSETAGTRGELSPTNARSRSATRTASSQPYPRRRCEPSRTHSPKRHSAPVAGSGTAKLLKVTLFPERVTAKVPLLSAVATRPFTTLLKSPAMA